jgi:hypothetical protein
MTYSPWDTQPDRMICELTSTNNNYQLIAKDFFEKYANASNKNISYLSNFYHQSSLISINIYHGVHNDLYELTGFDDFRNKLIDLKINSMKYHSMNYTSQPIGDNSILIIYMGKVEINRMNYSVITTFIIKNFNFGAKIINHIINFFVPT